MYEIFCHSVCVYEVSVRQLAHVYEYFLPVSQFICMEVYVSQFMCKKVSVSQFIFFCLSVSSCVRKFLSVSQFICKKVSVSQSANVYESF